MRRSLELQVGLECFHSRERYELGTTKISPKSYRVPPFLNAILLYIKNMLLGYCDKSIPILYI